MGDAEKTTILAAARRLRRGYGDDDDWDDEDEEARRAQAADHRDRLRRSPSCCSAARSPRPSLLSGDDTPTTAAHRSRCRLVAGLDAGRGAERDHRARA